MFKGCLSCYYYAGKKDRERGSHVSCKFHTNNEKEMMEYSGLHFLIILNSATGIKCVV